MPATSPDLLPHQPTVSGSKPVVLVGEWAKPHQQALASSVGHPRPLANRVAAQICTRTKRHQTIWYYLEAHPLAHQRKQSDSRRGKADSPRSLPSPRGLNGRTPGDQFTFRPVAPPTPQVTGAQHRHQHLLLKAPAAAAKPRAVEAPAVIAIDPKAPRPRRAATGMARGRRHRDNLPENVLGAKPHPTRRCYSVSGEEEPRKVCRCESVPHRRP